MRLFSSIFRCQSGATAIEYGLILALIVVALIMGSSLVGNGIATTLNTASTELNN